MIYFIIILAFMTPGIVFIANMFSIENIMWKNFDMTEFKRPIWQFFNPINVFFIFLFGYGWVFSSHVRHSVISSILQQMREKIGDSFERRALLRDVGLTLYDKFG